MAKPKVLVTHKIPRAVRATLDEACDVDYNDASSLAPADLRSRLADKDGAITVITDAMTAEVMDAAPGLKVISNIAVGINNIDVAAARARGIVVTNTPDVLNEEVADTALGLLLATVRQFPQADRYVREGKWKEKPFPLTVTLQDRTVGVVGMGRIGKAIAKRLEAFNAPVVYHSRNKAEGVSYKHYPDLRQMAKDADVLVVITPGGAATKHLINKEVLEALGPNGIVINVARGSVIDENALIDALREKKILSAGLDVFEDEPNVPQALIDMEHVVLLPHVGSASVHCRNLMGQLVVDNLVAWANGKPPLTPVAETPWPPKKK